MGRTKKKRDGKERRGKKLEEMGKKRGERTNGKNSEEWKETGRNRRKKT